MKYCSLDCSYKNCNIKERKKNMSNNNFIDNINPAKLYSSEIYAKAKKYQKQYGFKIGSGKHDTWNNEADAFKHAFMQADLALKTTIGLSKIAGDVSTAL
ncbi:MAG: hypothetical protein BHW64_03120 [Candidatus Melainabacteria bacterium LEY3_CP_29_8]|nr:MAG: hypothetical protein BHW64_03120 [Candidatus Melainabacteria bacterium LEY3_CP_29_8]